MAGLADRAIRAGMRAGMRRGLGDGSRFWLVVGSAALGIRLLQRLSTPKPTVIREELHPGETILITHLSG